MDTIAPPICRAMLKLDRSRFTKTFQLSAARIFKRDAISKCVDGLTRSRDVLRMPKIIPIRPDPNPELAGAGGKCLLLRPSIKHDDPLSWSQTLQNLVSNQFVGLIPYEMSLNYDHWSHWDILQSVLPEDQPDGIPSGFSMIGHIVHLNLREASLPYKGLIGQVILDKVQRARTVINKIDTVGEESEFRTFRYEILAGDEDMNVEVSEGDCIFRFDFSKIYWNPRLQCEHGRIVSLFKEGDAVCDVMAGAGPFAVPAGKKRVFVWANDLNPECFSAMKDAIKYNKVNTFVRPSCADGHVFIRDATRSLLTTRYETFVSDPVKKQRNSPPARRQRVLTQPEVFSHYVMNLPGSAMTFLPAFRGVYPPSARALFQPLGKWQLPMIHVYLFKPKFADPGNMELEIASDISSQLGHTITPTDADFSLHAARDVAPNKIMYSASFRLPEEVAFADDASPP